MKLKKNIAISETGFIFDSDTGDSYSTNETGKKILKLVGEGKNENEILDIIIENYDVDKMTAENNLNDFVTVLKNHKIIE